jgi:hypothetical protein
MTDITKPTTSVGTPRKAASVGGQTLAVVGIVVCIVLAALVILARGWAVDQVDAVGDSIDAGLARGIPALQAADTRVAEVGTRVQEVADAATAVATSDAVAPQVAQALSGRLSGISERYLPLRAGYADARSDLVSALDRVQAVQRFVPGITVPQGPIDALASLDQAVRAVDERITGILAANQAGTAIRETAQRVADAAPGVQTALGDVSTRLANAETRLNEARADVTSTMDRITSLITIVTLLILVLLVYVAALHVVLLRAAGRLRKDRPTLAA